MSSITAGTTSTTTLVHSGDTTGSLVFKTNDTGSGGTTAVTIDTSQRAAFVAGTAALPAITTSGDTNTGIYFPAADTIAFAEGGAEAMRIDSSGNVGIGTSSPTTATDIVRSNTSGNDNQMPNLFVRNTSATQGNGSSTFNQAAVSVSAGNSTVSGGIRAAYDSAGSYGTGVQFYVNSTNPLQFYSNGSERMRIDSSGNLLVGTTTSQGLVTLLAAGGSSSSVALSIRPVSDTLTAVNFRNAAGSQVGNISITSTATAYNTSSDYRLKENIAPMTGALSVVQQLKPVTYKWKLDGTDSQGFIAHELAEVVPDCVTGIKDAVDADGNPIYQGIDTSFLVATLTAAIQELKAINDQQAETINAQSEAIASLTARVVALESRGTV